MGDSIKKIYVRLLKESNQEIHKSYCPRRVLLCDAWGDYIKARSHVSDESSNPKQILSKTLSKVVFSKTPFTRLRVDSENGYFRKC